MSRSNDHGYNLLRIRAIRTIISWAWFPYIIQIIMLMVFTALAVNGWWRFAPEGVNDKLYAKTNITNLLIWGLWWPAIVWIAVLFGRAWCMVCPLELIANGTERLGRILRMRQFILNKWLRSGWLILGIYALIQLFIAGAHLHRIPAYTSIFLWSLLGIAGLVGFFFKDRAFCRGFCPVGILLSSYGRGGMLAVRAGSGHACRGCTGKDCIMACNRAKLYGRSCPSLLNPPKLNSNRDCLVCGQCIKSCKPDNMQLILRRPFHPADIRDEYASWPVTLFILMVSGFVTGELCSEWKTAQHIFLWLPEHFTGGVGLGKISGWVEGMWMIGVYPVLLWALFGIVYSIGGSDASVIRNWRFFALPIVVVVSAGHMAKGLAKFVSWAGFLPGAIKDPPGLHTILGISSKVIPLPASLMSLSVVSFIGITLVVVGMYFAYREARLSCPEKYRKIRAPIFLLGILFIVIISGWK
ncbi:4Fe-4S binding protein [Candidatus Kuenenia sp.]|uniref:4Fe-4S binding protein n=1 Tax=Candidatus Kuenenia sp. TaxID=2499824 RepID=UPI00321FEC5A